MIGCLLEKGLIKDYLHKYPSNEWSQVIPALVQLGIIHLYDNFNQQLITNDLSKLVENILKDNIHNRYQREERGRQMPRKKQTSAQSPKWIDHLNKPSNNWRTGDDEIFDRSLSKLRSLYSTESSIYC
jgi:hypothetical protein